MLDQDAIGRFHRDGFLVVRDLLDDAELKGLRTAVDSTVAMGVAGEGAGHSYRHVNGRDQYFRTDGVWDYDTAFRDVTVKPELLAIVGQLLGHPFVPVNDTIVVKLPHSGCADRVAPGPALRRRRRARGDVRGAELRH